MSSAQYSGWGNLASAPPRELLARDWRFDPLPPPAQAPLLAIGMRRSYGDVCVNEGGTVLSTRSLDRLVRFDRDTGLLECDAGITLGEILRVVVPCGWFLPVVPGTRNVTLGGAIANDVHGKNHARAGSFGCHLRELELLRSDRGRIACSADMEPALFRATIAGLGLTGMVTRARLQLRRVPGALIDSTELPFRSWSELLELQAGAGQRDYSVAWIDSSRLGRGLHGLLSTGDHAAGMPPRARLSVSVPSVPPVALVGNASAWCFARAHAALHRSAKPRLCGYPSFFFPLDGIGGWNRLYGSRGFMQYQCVIPAPSAAEGVAELLGAVHASALVSPLIVLKDFGPIASPGLLSFPREGHTLAMDFANSGAPLRVLFARLDAIVRAHGGALYPAKDARMSPEMFRASFPRLEQFRLQLDPAFSSSFWRRVG